MDIPDTLLDGLKSVPHDRPVTLLIRHSARYPIVDPAETFLVDLTPEGVRLAEKLGRLLGQYFPGGRLLSAPVGRCHNTAQAIARGAGWVEQVQADERLSHPFIEPAFGSFIRGEVDDLLPQPVREVIALLLEHAGEDPMLDVMVTHDTIVATVVGYLLKAPVLKEIWTEFLEGMFVWCEEDQVFVRWRRAERCFKMEEELI